MPYGPRQQELVKIAAWREIDAAVRMGGWMSFVAGLAAGAVAPGGHIGQGLVDAAVRAISRNFLTRVMADYLAGQRRIFDDPPRWDYRVVGGFEEPTSLAWFSRQRTVPDWVTAAPNLGNPDRLAYVLALTVGWLSAMVTAMERAAGASADDAEDWAVTQQRAAEEFAARGAEGLQRVREAALALQRRRGIERIPELPPLIEDREFSTDEILAQTVFFLLDERELGRALAALSAEA